MKLPEGYYFAHTLGFEGNPYAWILKDIYTLYNQMYLTLLSVQQQTELNDLMDEYKAIINNEHHTIDGITSISKIVSLLNAMLLKHITEFIRGNVYQDYFAAKPELKKIHEKTQEYVVNYNYCMNISNDSHSPAQQRQLQPEISNVNDAVGGAIPVSSEGNNGATPESSEVDDGAKPDNKEGNDAVVGAMPSESKGNNGVGGNGSSGRYKIAKAIFITLFALSGLACLAMVVLSKQILNTAITKIFNSNLFIAIFSVFCAFAVAAIICNIPVVKKAIQASFSYKPVDNASAPGKSNKKQ